ncbi:MAG: cysteine-rich CWC family protein [Oligoflexales bacterium]
MKYQPEPCPLCNRLFVCKVGNISQCQCAQADLTKEVIRFLEVEFDNCLCISCLKLINGDKNPENQTREKLLEKVEYCKTSKR